MGISEHERWLVVLASNHPIFLLLSIAGIGQILVDQCLDTVIPFGVVPTSPDGTSPLPLCGVMANQRRHDERTEGA